MFPESGVVQNPPENHILYVAPSLRTEGARTLSKFQGDWRTSMTTPCPVHTIPSEEVAYRIRFRTPSDPEYHIRYIVPSQRTEGVRAYTLSAEPPVLRSTTIPSRVQLALDDARTRSPDGSTSSFERVPARKSASDVWVQDRPRADGTIRTPKSRLRTRDTITIGRFTRITPEIEVRHAPRALPRRGHRWAANKACP